MATSKKKAIPKTARVVTTKQGGGVAMEEKPVPVWMSTGMIGAAIAGASWYARSQGVGEAINEDTITAGLLQTTEAVGIVMAAIGRYKAKNKLKLF